MPVTRNALGFVPDSSRPVTASRPLVTSGLGTLKGHSSRGQARPRLSLQARLYLLCGFRHFIAFLGLSFPFCKRGCG